MSCALLASTMSLVALHPEGVDRNGKLNVDRLGELVALHPEGVDRNLGQRLKYCRKVLSPSTRRAWIEMYKI